MLGEVLQPRQQCSDALGVRARLTNADMVKSASEPGTSGTTGDKEALAGHVSSSPKLSMDGGA